MRQPGGLLPAVSEPVPLHRAGRDKTKFSTANLTKFSTAKERTTTT